MTYVRLYAMKAVFNDEAGKLFFSFHRMKDNEMLTFMALMKSIIKK